MVTELIKCIRETLPKHTVGARNGESSKIDTEKVITRQKTYPLERKLREVQGQKIKMREEMLARMKEVDTVVKSLELKYFKRFSNSANRFEEAVDKKLQDIASVLLPRQDNDQLLKISNEALADLHSKLKEAIL